MVNQPTFAQNLKWYLQIIVMECTSQWAQRYCLTWSTSFNLIPYCQNYLHNIIIILSLYLLTCLGFTATTSCSQCPWFSRQEPLPNILVRKGYNCNEMATLQLQNRNIRRYDNSARCQHVATTLVQRCCSVYSRFRNKLKLNFFFWRKVNHAQPRFIEPKQKGLAVLQHHR